MKRQSFKDDMSVTDQPDGRETREEKKPLRTLINNAASSAIYNAYPWLGLVLSRFALCCGTRITASDLEMLSLSLQHLFQQLEILYTSDLPSLEEGEQGLKPHVHPQLARQHHHWKQLRQVLRTLERIEILCHLLNVTVMSILQTLDTPDGEQETDGSSSLHTADDEMIAWAEAAGASEEHLQRWQQCYTATAPLAFSCADAVLPSLRLDTLDEALQRILERALALFEDILPDLRVIKSTAPEEDALFICLLDLLQQNDDILIQIDTLLEPLDRLTGYYGSVLVSS